MRSPFASLTPALFCAALGSMIPLKADANPGCPSNYLSCGGQSFSSSDASYLCPDYQHQWEFNLTAGSFMAGASGPFNQGLTSGFATSDVYTVTGPPTGTPLLFEAVLTIHASAIISLCGYCQESHSAQCSVNMIDHGSTNSMSFGTSAPFLGYSGFPVCMQACRGSSIVDTTLRFSLAHAAGESFTLEYDLYAAAYNFGFADISAQLAFQDLPSGAQVTSCQGYLENFATPVRNGTWGAMKARYR